MKSILVHNYKPVSMKQNTLHVHAPRVEGNIIRYEYDVQGSWAEAFAAEEVFFIEYSCDVSQVPVSVLLIPLLSNVLPMAWVYDAAVYVPECDRAFLESLPEVKAGFEKMYPMLVFSGELHVEKIVDHTAVSAGGSAAFFSGGVDAFDTLVRHREEVPTLLTLWGSDIRLTDRIGWERVLQHLQKTAAEFGVDYVTIRSSFRLFLQEGVLSLHCKKSGDAWWHGFQHGMGIAGHAAPIAYLKGKQFVYLASSFTAADRVTCASHPEIEGRLKFCSAQMVHDGFEFHRQNKISHLVQFVRQQHHPLNLRVCWESSGATNCCRCEKCGRTILGILAEKADPSAFGFTQVPEMKTLYKDVCCLPPSFRLARYVMIQSALRESYSRESVPADLREFYGADLSRVPLRYRLLSLCCRLRKKFYPYYLRMRRCAGRVVRGVLRKK